MILSKKCLEHLVAVITGKGYKVFLKDDKPFNLNIVAIRTDNPVLDSFKCWLVVFWKYNGNLFGGTYPITTLPGRYYLIDRLLNRKGTALLAPGQYLGAYSIGMHRHNYKALIQQKPVSVYRDDNRDYVFDYDAVSKDLGMFGINIHRANKDGVTPKVGKNSAGCLVFRDSLDFDEFMTTCYKSKRVYGNSFTLTLLNESDLMGEDNT